MRRLEGDGGVTEPQWRPTYAFESRVQTRRGTRLDTHMLSVCMTVESYPTSLNARRALSSAHLPHLVDEWVARGLPQDDLHLLVCRPGDLGRTEGQRIHREDQASGLTREFGGVAVVLALANWPVDPDLVVARVRLD